MVEEYLKKLEESQDFDEILLDDLEADVPSELHECLMKSVQKDTGNKLVIPYKRFAAIAAGLIIMAFSVSLFASRINSSANIARDNRNSFNAVSQEGTLDLSVKEQAAPQSDAPREENEMLSKGAEDARSAVNEVFVLKTADTSVIDFLKRNAVYNEGTVYKLSRENLSALKKLLNEKSVIESKNKDRSLKIQESYSYKSDELVTIELIEK